MSERSSKVLPLLALVASGAFLAGVAWLFHLRFEAGDIYPPYSSLRSDPLGVKVFWESLNGLGSLSATRNYKPLSKLEPSAGTTLFYLGVPLWTVTSIPQGLAEDLEAIAARGGRVVVSFRAEDEELGSDEEEELDPGEDEKGRDGAETGPPRPVEDREHEDSRHRWISLAARWGFSFVRASVASGGVAQKADGREGMLPAEIPWHDAVGFGELDDSWRIVYRTAELPVLVERRFEEGSIVLCADSYGVSNEALWREPQTGLLSWLVGPNGTVVFDETHLGVTESTGVAGLMRKYRLHGFFFGMLVLFALFVWNRSAGFGVRSRLDGSGVAETPPGGDSAATALANLLRRGVQAKDLLSTCLQEWERSQVVPSKGSQEVLETVRRLVERQAQLPARRRDPAGTYRAVCQVLAARRPREREAMPARNSKKREKTP